LLRLSPCAESPDNRTAQAKKQMIEKEKKRIAPVYQRGQPGIRRMKYKCITINVIPGHDEKWLKQ